MAPTPTSTAHVRKRQYQPSITSYLTRSDSAPERTIRSPLSPPLPAETQASLLSVGMRVRKSVSEGYKTHKTLGTDGFPFPSSAPSAPPRQAYHTTCSRELMPFCGLHKTGGLAQQENIPPPPSASAAMRGGEHGEDWGTPSLSFPQNSVASTQSSFFYASSAESGASKKRSYDDEIEDEMDAFFDEADVLGAGVTAPPTRPIAKPRGSLRKAATTGGTIVVADDYDFEEAAFLSPMDVDV